MREGSVCVLGSLNVDLVVSLERFHNPGETISGVDFKTFTGGKGGNQAAAAARLGAQVRMIGCVGEDAHGRMYREVMAARGIDHAFVCSEPDVPTGVALIEVDASGENRIAVVPGANRALTCGHVTRALPAIEASDVVLMQLEVPIASVNHAAALAKRAGASVMLDPAPAPNYPIPDALFMLCDYLTPNEHELRALTGMPSGSEEEAIAACAALLRRGARAVINKRGEQGALYVTPAGARAFPAYPVHAVDTTGAGDTFNAGLGVGLSMGMEIEDAIRLAGAAAALSTTAMGAQSALPTLAEAFGLVGEAAF